MIGLPDKYIINKKLFTIVRLPNHLIIQSSCLLIRLYQWCISPWLGVRCRFEPTCSHYAVTAIETHGTIKGGWLTIRRLLRCNPFGGMGYDPIPHHHHQK